MRTSARKTGKSTGNIPGAIETKYGAVPPLKRIWTGSGDETTQYKGKEPEAK